MHSKHTLTALISLVALVGAGCSEIPPEAHYNRGSPESLLDVSSEVVNFQLNGLDAVHEVADWVNQDQPTRAELYCAESDLTCLETKDMLMQFGVPITFIAAADNTVTLIYERILARDCENRFIDNSINPYNFNHPTFGCSLASNMVQMVTDKQQFVSPALLDYADGHKTQQSLEGYRMPYDTKPAEIDSNFDTQFQSSP